MSTSTQTVPARTSYTRDELITICERAVVLQSHWRDRDSAHSMIGVGTVWALLKAGCEFTVLDGPNLKTDKRTIWIEITYHGFQHFEIGETAKDHFYLPTPARLDKCLGRDWY